MSKNVIEIIDGKLGLYIDDVEVCGIKELTLSAEVGSFPELKVNLIAPHLSGFRGPSGHAAGTKEVQETFNKIINCIAKLNVMCDDINAE